MYLLNDYYGPVAFRVCSSEKSKQISCPPGDYVLRGRQKVNRLSKENIACYMLTIQKKKNAKQEMKNLKYILDYEIREDLTEKETSW